MIRKILIIVIILSFNAYGGTFGNLQQYFEKETHSNNVLYISGYAHLNFIGGFADGQYALKSYSIETYAKDIYIMHIVVKKKKRYFRFIQKFNMPFFYNGKIIAFKTIRGKMVYSFGNDDIEIIKMSHGWKIIRHRSQINVKLPVRGGYLFLLIKKPY